MTDAASNNRNVQRARVLREGKIVYGNFTILIDCVVRDMSDGGAKIKVASQSGIPEEFYLYLPNLRLMHKVEVRWRRGDQIGVRFEGEPIEVNKSSDPRYARFRMI